jgi:hypothetical protein
VFIWIKACTAAVEEAAGGEVDEGDRTAAVWRSRDEAASSG